MSDAIKNAIEAMEFAQHAVGPFNRVATKKLRESIAELQAAQAQAQAGEGEAPVAWMHKDRKKIDVIGADVKRMFENMAKFYGPHGTKHVDKGENYTIPLYTAPPAAAVNQQLLEALQHIMKMQTFGYIVLGEEATTKARAAIAAAQEQK